MSGPHCVLVSDGGLPVVVRQALDDDRLPPAAKAVIWYLHSVLDFHAYREQKVESVARGAGVKDRTAARMLLLLVARGYLDEHGTQRPRAFRMPWSRRQSMERRAA